jgi:hypothetical protein
MIVYPETGYNSFVSVEEAHEYFTDRLNAGAWDAADQPAALKTGFRSLATLEIVIDLSEAAALQAIKNAQCEQALWESTYNRDEPAARGVSIGGLISAQFFEQGKPERYAPRALEMLRPYLRARTVSRIR